MCWFGARWNVQRNVTCIVICTIPWTNRYVNTYRDVWAHPAHVCFSVNCYASQCNIVLCVSVRCRHQYDAGHLLLQASIRCRTHAAAVLVHMRTGITIHKPQVNSKCAVSKRLHTVHCAVLIVFFVCDRDCDRSYRARCVHEAMLAHPPNLSILVSGGVHTTLYVFSHCERTRIISQLQSFACALNCCTHM